MLKSLSKQLAVQGTDDCNYCDLCYKSDGRLRFGCGHWGCADCVATGQCPTCEPLMEPSSDQPPFDGPHTRAKNSSELPNLQDTLQIAEYQRQRISEKLRVEKELFPECIQAPVKYFNKRKSLNVSKRDKENRHTTIFPGEVTSPSEDFIMNKSRSYVQEWLNKQPNTSFGPQPRSPFSDLKVNTHHKQATHSTPVKDTQKENVPKLLTRQSNRKRSRLKQTPSTTSQKSLESYLKPLEKGNNKKAWSAKRIKQEFDTKHIKSKVDGKQQSPENVLGFEDCYTIEDTQDQVVDKDKLALLEVHKANLNEISETVVVIGDTEEFPHKTSLVPFLKKSYLFENCAQCKDTLSSQDSSPENTPVKSSDVSITVENKSFITTISVVDINPGKKHSTAVQTDVEEPFLGFQQPAQPETTCLIAKMKEYIETEDIARVSEVTETDSQKTSCTDVILNKQENEAHGKRVWEDDIQPSFGHSSEQDFGVLNPLDRAGIPNKRARGGRGATPDSNNSSDKENCDPNKRKKGDSKKKKKNK